MVKNNFPLKVVIRPSILKKNAPLLVMLHGYGSDENDLFSFAEELPDRLFILSLRAPHPLTPFGQAWYAINFDTEQNNWNDVNQAKESMKTILDCVEIACDLYSLDNSNVNLLGFSQGCILSMALALNHPKKFKNIIGLSGYICQEFLVTSPNENDYDHLEFYCSHGSADQVIPVDWARKTPKILEQFGIKHHYNEFPVGHGVSPQNFFEFRQWLENRI